MRKHILVITTFTITAILSICSSQIEKPSLIYTEILDKLDRIGVKLTDRYSPRIKYLQGKEMRANFSYFLDGYDDSIRSTIDYGFVSFLTTKAKGDQMFNTDTTYNNKKSIYFYECVFMDTALSRNFIKLWQARDSMGRPFIPRMSHCLVKRFNKSVYVIEPFDNKGELTLAINGIFDEVIKKHNQP